MRRLRRWRSYGQVWIIWARYSVIDGLRVLVEQDAAAAAAQALEAAHEATKARIAADRTMMSEAETTIHTGIGSAASGSRPSSTAPGTKKFVKAKLTPKEKKERSVSVQVLIFEPKLPCSRRVYFALL